MSGPYDDDYPEEHPRDSAIDEALPRVIKIFQDEPARVFYSTQIETRLERDYFHWITNKALAELANGGKLQRLPVEVQNKRVHFYAHPKYRYLRREQKSLQELLERIFDSQFTHAIGRHAEMLFDSALARNGFMPVAKDVKEWNGVRWVQTNHNLDRIVLRDGVAYGVEIKNTQNYIQREELEKKLALCRHLNLVPLFIMRFAPKSYIFDISQRHRGFALLFEEQIYPFAQDALLAEVRTKLGLKVQSPIDVKQGDMQRLVNWHTARLARLQVK